MGEDSAMKDTGYREENRSIERRLTGNINELRSYTRKLAIGGAMVAGVIFGTLFYVKNHPIKAIETVSYTAKSYDNETESSAELDDVKKEIAGLREDYKKLEMLFREHNENESSRISGIEERLRKLNLNYRLIAELVAKGKTEESGVVGAYEPNKVSEAETADNAEKTGLVEPEIKAEAVDLAGKTDLAYDSGEEDRIMADLLVKERKKQALEKKLFSKGANIAKIFGAKSQLKGTTEYRLFPNPLIRDFEMLYYNDLDNKGFLKVCSNNQPVLEGRGVIETDEVEISCYRSGKWEEEFEKFYEKAVEKEKEDLLRRFGLEELLKKD